MVRGNSASLMVPLKEALVNSVPVVVVIRGVQALFGIIGRKEHVGCFVSLE